MGCLYTAGGRKAPEGHQDCSKHVDEREKEQMDDAMVNGSRKRTMGGVMFDHIYTRIHWSNVARKFSLRKCEAYGVFE